MKLLKSNLIIVNKEFFKLLFSESYYYKNFSSEIVKNGTNILINI